MNKVAKWSIHSKRFKIIAIIIIVLIAARIALPYIVLHYSNKKLANMKSLYGHIDDIDIALFRGAYKIDTIFINKKDSLSGEQTQLFNSDMIDLSLEWSALFKGRLVGELIFVHPTLIFTKDKTEPKDIQKISADLKNLLDGFMPLKLDKFEINEGIIKYVDQIAKPAVHIQMDNTYVLAQNLSNVVDSTLLPSTVKATSNIYGGTVDFNMKLNALKNHPTFDLNAKLENLQLPELNDLFQAYANVDVSKGTLALYTEIAAKDGKFTGYVKPILKNLDVVGKEDRKDSFFQKLWEGAIGTVGVILRNQKKDQVATKLPIAGTFDNSNSNTWHAILVLFTNAFIKALQPTIDAEINIHSVNKELDK